MGGACGTFGGEDSCRVMVGKLQGKRVLWRTDVDGTIIHNWILTNSVGMAWTGLILLRTGTSSGALWTRFRIFGRHKMQIISWRVIEGLEFHEKLCSLGFIRVWKVINEVSEKHSVSISTTTSILLHWHVSMRLPGYRFRSPDNHWMKLFKQFWRKLKFNSE